MERYLFGQELTIRGEGDGLVDVHCMRCQLTFKIKPASELMEPTLPGPVIKARKL
jgi:hypothetical protein